jgi:hypothetical protein
MVCELFTTRSSQLTSNCCDLYDHDAGDVHVWAREQSPHN